MLFKTPARCVRRKRQELLRFLLCAATLLCLASEARAQQASGNVNILSSSDLVQQNLSRVAATAAEIKSVLVKDAGLMVELKRWIAKDASDHGQVVSDSDLTSDSIFDRLETDVPFRSVATALIQRYGYLLPTLNPDSEVGKQRELLIQERTKRLAQDQEEASSSRRGEAGDLQDTNSCESRLDGNCSSVQKRPSAAGNSRQEQQQGQFPSRMIPGEPNPSTAPDLPGASGNALMRAQLTQTSQDSPALSSQLPLAGFYNSESSSNTLGMSDPVSIGAQFRRSGPATGASGNTTNRGNATDGLLAAYGSGVGTNSPSGVMPDIGGMDTRGAGTSSIGTSPTSSMQPSSRREQPLLPIQPPEMTRKPSPYTDIPSLYDMYVQAVTRPVTPRRFGSEVFENGTRDSQLIPMDLPVGPDYVVGPGDGLSVDLWGGISQRLYRTVDREGRVSLPEVGPILVSGKSLAAVQENVQQILRTEYHDVSADVSLSRLRTIRIYEVGDVTSPGAYDISSLSTPLNALFVAGGPTPLGSMRIVKHYRGTQLVETVDVYDLLLHGVKADLQRLENGDTVQVPPIGPQVTVEGMVRRPAIYELRDEKSLASVLELAGGLLPTATLRHIEVQRIVSHQRQTMLNLDIPETDSDAAVTRKLEEFEIHDGDRVRIYPIVPYNQDAIYVEGHVVRPGRYSYRAGLRLTDVISSYSDLLPEPATRYAEIIRLNAPDFHPSVEGFDLADALNNPAQAPILHPMDTIRIFSKFDFENPPTVSVLGDVREPGTYRTSGQIRLMDAVHLAGGLSPDAQITDAQVFRYMPDGKFKIFSVSVTQAIGGDPVENIILQSRDRLLIHRNPETVNQSTVYIQGEVARPGRYPLTSNMHVADLIRVGGGLQTSADTQTADLTKFKWLDQAESAVKPNADSNAVSDVDKKLSGQEQLIALAAALAGDLKSNVPLSNGDVLTIRQLAGWNDLGASITLKGEVKHPGTYGIRPGERLSSILERAGGFQLDGYPYGAVLQRTQVRELEASARNEIILRVKGAEDDLRPLPDADAKQKQQKEIGVQQWQETLEQLNANPPSGRVTVRISSRIERWRNTSADIEIRAGDTLIIPKRPSYVMVTGQVFNPTAVSYRPGKSANWYLSQSGGPTQVANKKAMFVIRADGSVIGAKTSFWRGESLAATLEPGDTVVVPEKALGGGVQWQSVLLSAQTAASIASAVFIAVRP